MSKKRVIIELRTKMGTGPVDSLKMASELKVEGLTIDKDYEPVPIEPAEEMVKTLESAGEEIVLIRGEIDEDMENQLRTQPNVVNVWTDARIEPFGPVEISPFPFESAQVPALLTTVIPGQPKET